MGGHWGRSEHCPFLGNKTLQGTNPPRAVGEGERLTLKKRTPCMGLTALGGSKGKLEIPASERMRAGQNLLAKKVPRLCRVLCSLHTGAFHRSVPHSQLPSCPGYREPLASPAGVHFSPFAKLLVRTETTLCLISRSKLNK